MSRSAAFPIFVLACLLVTAFPAADDAPEREKDEDSQPVDISYSETVVTTASRTKERIEDAPAATTVIDAETIRNTAADDFGDLLRAVPGVNVSQMSANSIQVSTRQATTVLPRGQMVLVDGRSVYQEYNGFVLWDALPLDMQEVESIEVVRGPGSAVWGPNATDGVIQIKTRSPLDFQGTSIKVGVGDEGTRYGAVSHSGLAGSLGYKISGSYSQTDAYDRPTGTIPDTAGPTNPGGTPYPPYANPDVSLPRFNARLDWVAGEEDRFSVEGGWASTDGVIFTPGGPWTFDDSDSSHLRFGWSRRAMQVNAWANDVDYVATIILAGGQSRFQNRTYNVDFTDTRLIAKRNAITYGANLRHNEFDLEFAPTAEDRTDWGLFIQDEIKLGGGWRWLIGARLDEIDPIDPVVSPRTAVMFEPVEGQHLRLSYNQAFIAPTAVQNSIDLFGGSLYVLPGMGGPIPYFAPWLQVGNLGLDEEQHETVELGWNGRFGKALSAAVSVYRNDIEDLIRAVPTTFYTSANPPPGWPLAPALLDLTPPNGFGGVIVSEFDYLNIGKVTNQGVEAELNWRPKPAWNVRLNASWQDEPDGEGLGNIPLPGGGTTNGLNVPPEWRANAGVGWNGRRWFANGDVNYQDEAFWADILNNLFWGPTDSFVQVNGVVGVRLRGDQITLSLRGQNLLDEDVQQHVWGDGIGRRLAAQMTLRM